MLGESTYAIIRSYINHMHNKSRLIASGWMLIISKRKEWECNEKSALWWFRYLKLKAYTRNFSSANEPIFSLPFGFRYSPFCTLGHLVVSVASLYTSSLVFRSSPFGTLGVFMVPFSSLDVFSKPASTFVVLSVTPTPSLDLHLCFLQPQGFIQPRVVGIRKISVSGNIWLHYLCH